MLRTLGTTLRSIVSAMLGYAVIVLGTTIGFTYMLHGVSYHHSSPIELVLASGVAVASGLAGGWTAARVAGRQPLAHALGVLPFLIVDTTYVLTSGISQDPLWFDLMGGLTLMAAAVAGGWLQHLRSGRAAALGI